jgi:hypothetical protein
MLSDDEINKMPDEELIRNSNAIVGAHRTVPSGGPFQPDFRPTVEMTRRLKSSIIALDKSTSRYSKVLIVLTVVMMFMVLVQIILAYKALPYG